VVIGIAIFVVILSAIMIEMILDTTSAGMAYGVVYGIVVEATVIAELLVIAYHLFFHLHKSFKNRVVGQKKKPDEKFLIFFKFSNSIRRSRFFRRAFSLSHYSHFISFFPGTP